MCFYSKLSKKAVTLENRFKAKLEQPELFHPKSEINAFTFPYCPVITDKAKDKILFYRWGLIPFWAKDESISKNTLNARIETLTEKPSFRNSVQKRCLIPADGFYEWQWLDEKGKKKQKHLLRLQDDELFAFAGIYAEWIDKQSGELIPSYSIVTTKAMGLMETIHNSKKRMPLILDKGSEQRWLNGDNLETFGNINVPLEAVAL